MCCHRTCGRLRDVLSKLLKGLGHYRTNVPVRRTFF